MSLSIFLKMVPSTETSILSDILHNYITLMKFVKFIPNFSHINMENLSIYFNNFECPLCFGLIKDPVQIPCSNQHVICKMCCDKLFQIPVFEEVSYISKCCFSKKK